MSLRASAGWVAMTSMSASGVCGRSGTCSPLVPAENKTVDWIEFIESSHEKERTLSFFWHQKSAPNQAFFRSDLSGND